MRPEDQKRMVVEVTQRVLQNLAPNLGDAEKHIWDTLYEERQRLEQDKHHNGPLAFYRMIQKQALEASPKKQREILGDLIKHFAEEVLGHFSQSMYQVATRIVPYGLNFLLNTLSPLRLLKDFPNGFGKLDQQIIIQGDTSTIQTLAKQGTLVLVPTHVSNLDSILIGYSLHRLGLPPFLYGAGLNLFSNPVMGFFMDHLGAYKVDRKKKSYVYKEVLKAYAGYSMELGYHNLFFPGGTRSRSGKIEEKLKMGLLGMGLNAYIHNLINQKPKPDIFVVPCTLNYQLVLESPTLVEDYLKEVGKSRFIIEDDESFQVKKIIEFATKLFSLESAIHVVISHPLDLFGNQVDAKGRSKDHRGRIIDRQSYIMKNKQVAFDAQRDREYTQELGHSIREAFIRDTVLGPVQLVSWTLFRWLRESNPELDIYRLLRTGGAHASIRLTDAYSRMEKLRAYLKKKEKSHEIRLDPSLHQKDPVIILSQALAHLKSFHQPPSLERRGDRLFHLDRHILYYYQNRVPDWGDLP